MRGVAMSGCLRGLIRTRMGPNDGTSKVCLIGQAGEIGLTMSAARLRPRDNLGEIVLNN